MRIATRSRMNIQITFRDFPTSEFVRTHVENRAAKLLAHADRVTSMKVALEAPHHHQTHGHAYRVRIEIVVPGGELVVTSRDGEESHSDLYVAIDDAFLVAERRLRERVQIRRGEVKTHARS